MKNDKSKAKTLADRLVYSFERAFNALLSPKHQYEVIKGKIKNSKGNNSPKINREYDR